MAKPELPPSLRPLAQATDQQIAAYMVELCEELRSAVHTLKSRPEGPDVDKLDQLLAEIQDEARRQAEAEEPPQN